MKATELARRPYSPLELRSMPKQSLYAAIATSNIPGIEVVESMTTVAVRKAACIYSDKDSYGHYVGGSVMFTAPVMKGGLLYPLEDRCTIPYAEVLQTYTGLVPVETHYIPVDGLPDWKKYIYRGRTGTSYRSVSRLRLDMIDDVDLTRRFHSVHKEFHTRSRVDMVEPC